MVKPHTGIEGPSVGIVCFSEAGLLEVKGKGSLWIKAVCGSRQCVLQDCFWFFPLADPDVGF